MQFHPPGWGPKARLIILGRPTGEFPVAWRGGHPRPTLLCKGVKAEAGRSQAGIPELLNGLRPVRPLTQPSPEVSPQLIIVPVTILGLDGRVARRGVIAGGAHIAQAGGEGRLFEPVAGWQDVVGQLRGRRQKQVVDHQ